MREPKVQIKLHYFPVIWLSWGLHLQSSLESCHLDKEDKGVTRFFPMIFLLMLHSKPSCVRWPCVITRLCYLYCQRTGTEGLGKGNSNHKIIPDVDARDSVGRLIEW